jgi:hypothetical protein
MRTRRGVPAVAAALAAFALLAAGCGTPNSTAQARLEGHAAGHAATTGATEPTASTGSAGHTDATASGHGAKPVVPAQPAALRGGEKIRTVTSPVA